MFTCPPKPAACCRGNICFSVAEPVDPVRPHPCLELLRLLVHDGWSMKGAAERLGISLSKCWRRFRGLVRLGWIRRLGRAHYQITKNGLALLASVVWGCL